MVNIPNKEVGPKPSKFLPKDVETELRINVLDAADAVQWDTAPQLIIGNLETGCHGTYFHTPNGVEFFFHHCKMKYATNCKCIIQATTGETTHQIPPDLDRYRIRLICGESVPFCLEPKLAAMVVMKIFLGMSVPESLQMSEYALEYCKSG